MVLFLLERVPINPNSFMMTKSKSVFTWGLGGMGPVRDWDIW